MLRVAVLSIIRSLRVGALQNDNINRRQHRVVSPGRTHVGKQGFTYGSGASAETVGAQQVCMNVLPMPDGARAKVHYHKGIETIAYLLSGECIVFYGDALEHHVTAYAGDQVFVPPDVPHAHILDRSSASPQDAVAFPVADPIST